MSLPYVFFFMYIFAYSIPQSIWPPIIRPSPCPRTLLDPEASPQDKTSSTNNFLWDFIVIGMKITQTRLRGHEFLFSLIN